MLSDSELKQEILELRYKLKFENVTENERRKIHQRLNEIREELEELKRKNWQTSE